MSTSTINNLAEHLNWLLRERPFIPPTRPILPITESSSAVLLSSAQSTSFTRENQLSQRHALVAPPTASLHTAETPPHPAEPETIQQKNSAAPTVTSREEAKSEDMARLRAVPGSGNKPGLLSQAHPTEAKTPCMAQYRIWHSIDCKEKRKH
jgi:bloom syndrome protein